MSPLTAPPCSLSVVHTLLELLLAALMPATLEPIIFVALVVEHALMEPLVAQMAPI